MKKDNRVTLFSQHKNYVGFFIICYVSSFFLLKLFNWSQQEQRFYNSQKNIYQQNKKQKEQLAELQQQLAGLQKNNRLLKNNCKNLSQKLSKITQIQQNYHVAVESYIINQLTYLNGLITEAYTLHLTNQLPRRSLEEVITIATSFYYFYEHSAIGKDQHQEIATIFCTQVASIYVYLNDINKAETYLAKVITKSSAIESTIILQKQANKILLTASELLKKKKATAEEIKQLQNRINQHNLKLLSGDFQPHYAQIIIRLYQAYFASILLSSDLKKANLLYPMALNILKKAIAKQPDNKELLKFYLANYREAGYLSHLAENRTAFRKIQKSGLIAAEKLQKVIPFESEMTQIELLSLTLDYSNLYQQKSKVKAVIKQLETYRKNLLAQSLIKVSQALQKYDDGSNGTAIRLINEAIAKLIQYQDKHQNNWFVALRISYVLWQKAQFYSPSSQEFQQILKQAEQRLISFLHAHNISRKVKQHPMRILLARIQEDLAGYYLNKGKKTQAKQYFGEAYQNLMQLQNKILIPQNLARILKQKAQ